MARKITVVDDDGDVGKAISDCLHTAGYHPIIITDAEQAFPIIKSQKPDLVITDVMMPKISGYELCRLIRKDPLIFMTPVIAVSAFSGKPEVAHAIEQGADEFIAKPFNVGDLFAKIKSLLERHRRSMQKDLLTGFHGLEYIKKVISNKLFRGEVVAACYINLTSFTPYTGVNGDQKRVDAAELLADTLREVARDAGLYECTISYLGRYDFLVLLPVRDFERYCREVMSRFRLRRDIRFASEDLDSSVIPVKGDNGEQAVPSPISIVIGVVTTERIKIRDGTHMIQVAGELNRRAHKDGTAGHLEILREGMLF